MNSKTNKLFTISIKDCEIQTFRCGGKGGQNVNKRDTGVRIIHNESGARGESRQYNSQEQNKRVAFRKMAETKEFKNWVKLEAARLSGKPTVEEIVEDLMKPENIRVEVKNKKGEWTNLPGWFDIIMGKKDEI